MVVSILVFKSTIAATDQCLEYDITLGKYLFGTEYRWLNRAEFLKYVCFIVSTILDVDQYMTKNEFG